MLPDRARGGGGAGGGLQPPTFFENYKELLRKKCFSPPTFKVAQRALPDWKNICTSAKAVITEQTNNSAVKIFSCLFLESKFSAFWPNSVGLISKTIQPIYPKFCTELAKGVNYINVLGIFFLFTWFWRNFLKTASYRCKTAISTLQFDKKQK